jgi:hypothetical protein
MQVGYSGKTLVPNYSCVRGNQLYGTKRCQSVGGRRIERIVLDAVFEALQPAGIEATLRALEHAEGEHQARVRSAELERERAQIHAPDRARPRPRRKPTAHQQAPGDPPRRRHGREPTRSTRPPRPRL